ncbi:uncharacterized protein LOC130993906 [Salvia miltiorrhiza]|uniref:uncharacterized protein LOC130993906 n=1 Tax=Salvia miltiorrhiza TaxID=226208 RepID=UPI0025AC3D16|nr:uncharacterized protein LOC130993906 [Salvia miltiorrhiza]
MYIMVNFRSPHNLTSETPPLLHCAAAPLSNFQVPRRFPTSLPAAASLPLSTSSPAISLRRQQSLSVTTSGAGSSSTINGPNARVEPEASPKEVNIEVDLQLEPSSKVVDLLNLPSDPGLRPNIMSYPPNMIEQVRRAYLLKGPCQPRNHDFPQKIEANRKRKFVSAWFDEFKMWLEYSIAKDAAFCLYCYLFSSGSSEDGFYKGLEILLRRWFLQGNMTFFHWCIC